MKLALLCSLWCKNLALSEMCVENLLMSSVIMFLNIMMHISSNKNSQPAWKSLCQLWHVLVDAQETELLWNSMRQNCALLKKTEGDDPNHYIFKLYFKIQLVYFMHDF